MATNISRQRLIPGGLENPNDQYPSSHLFEFMLPLSHLNPISSNDSMLPFPNQKASMCCFDTMLPFSSNEPSVAPMNPIVLTPTPSIPLDGTQVLQERSQDNDLQRRQAVPVACVFCVRSKTRCDMARPCSRCVRRGTQSGCIDRDTSSKPKVRRKRGRHACLPCSNAKVACQRTRPCLRCVRIGSPSGCIDRGQELCYSKPLTVDLYYHPGKTVDINFPLPESVRKAYSRSFLRFHPDRVKALCMSSVRLRAYLACASEKLDPFEISTLRQALIEYGNSGNANGLPMESDSHMSDEGHVLLQDAAIASLDGTLVPGDWRISLNRQAQKLWGITSDGLQSHLIRTHNKSNLHWTPVPLFWRLFHPSSWATMGQICSEMFIMNPSSWVMANLYLSRINGHSVLVRTSWRLHVWNANGATFCRIVVAARPYC